MDFICHWLFSAVLKKIIFPTGFTISKYVVICVIMFLLLCNIIEILITLII